MTCVLRVGIPSSRLLGTLHNGPAFLCSSRTVPVVGRVARGHRLGLLRHATTMAAPGPLSLVVCGPSGVGKGTLIGAVMARYPDKFGFSVSHTTRQPRDGETDGVHYHFVDASVMRAEVAEGKFVEHAEVHGNMYGTSKAAIRRVLDEGRCCVLDIDVQGARSMRASGQPALFVFVEPPSFAELERRLRGRGTETEDKIARRLETAKKELSAIGEAGLFDFVLRNDSLEEATTSLSALAHRALRGCQAEAPGTATPFRVTALPALPSGMARWRGRTALVTGASAGIGRQLVLALARAGMRVVAVARRESRLRELVADAEGLGAEGPILALPLNVTDEAAVESIPSRIQEAFGAEAGIDVCVNNAGIGIGGTALMDGDTARWRHILDVNVLALCMTTRVAVQDMERRGAWGQVVNLCSMAGHRVPPGNGGFYAGTKHMVRALTQALRNEAHARGVPLRVGCVSPGFVDTEFFLVRYGGDREAATLPIDRPLAAEDVAAAVLFQLAVPEHVDVNDIMMRPLQQQF